MLSFPTLHQRHGPTPPKLSAKISKYVLTTRDKSHWSRIVIAVLPWGELDAPTARGKSRQLHVVIAVLLWVVSEGFFVKRQQLIVTTIYPPPRKADPSTSPVPHQLHWCDGLCAFAPPSFCFNSCWWQCVVANGCSGGEENSPTWSKKCALEGVV